MPNPRIILRYRYYAHLLRYSRHLTRSLYLHKAPLVPTAHLDVFQVRNRVRNRYLPQFHHVLHYEMGLHLIWCIEIRLDVMLLRNQRLFLRPKAERKLPMQCKLYLHFVGQQFALRLLSEDQLNLSSILVLL